MSWGDPSPTYAARLAILQEQHRREEAMTDWLCACANQGADVARCTIIRVDHPDGTATLGLVDTEACARRHHARRKGRSSGRPPRPRRPLPLPLLRTR